MRINFTAFLLRCCCGNRIYLDGAEEKGKSMGICFLCVQYCRFVLTTDEIIVARWESIACMGYYCVILPFLIILRRLLSLLLAAQKINALFIYLSVVVAFIHYVVLLQWTIMQHTMIVDILYYTGTVYI